MASAERALGFGGAGASPSRDRHRLQTVKRLDLVKRWFDKIFLHVERKILSNQCGDIDLIYRLSLSGRHTGKKSNTEEQC